MKVLLVHNFDLIRIFEEWKEDGYSAHHLWGATELDKYDIDVDILPFEGNTFLKNISTKIKILGDLDQQLRVIFNHQQYDVIYSGHHLTTSLLAFLRKLGLFNKPIVAIAHKTFAKNFWSQIFTDLCVKGNDKILCLSDETRKILRDSFQISEDKLEFLPWGIDVKIPKFNDSQIDFEPPKSGYILSAGVSYRDYETLISAFQEINYPLHIFGYGRVNSFPANELPKNVTIHNESLPTPKLLDKYQNAYFVAIPLNINQDKPCNAFGLTSVLEAMAMGKAVVITKNKYMGLDVEKEGVGLTVETGDVEAWKKTISYLLQNPELVKEMRIRGRKLVKDKFNLEKFSLELARHIKTLNFGQKGILRK
jgi:glycosyltransferase involved in cell wall biosynthesis